MTPELLALHQEAKSLSKQIRWCESALLDVLTKIENVKGYLPLGFNSLFQYCIQYLQLTESQSYGFMSIARKSEEIPELKKAVQNQEMTFSNARKLVSVITPENKETWISKGKKLSQRALEKEIVKANPNPPVKESLRPVSENESKLIVGLDEEMEKDLARIKALTGTAGTKEVFKLMMKDYLKRYDPLERAKREKKSRPVRPLGVRPVPSRYIPRKVFHEVQRRDGGRCQFKSVNGTACGSPYWTEVHHLEPWAYGGKHEENNLVTLCRAHHQYWHAPRSKSAEPPPRK